uniref:Uncharacterized protein n=1 Tax=Anguilla anguilla TaxID=7936 RepID=A0A0E9TMV5_ANGAN
MCPRSAEHQQCHSRDLNLHPLLYLQRTLSAPEKL